MSLEAEHERRAVLALLGSMKLAAELSYRNNGYNGADLGAAQALGAAYERIELGYHLPPDEFVTIPCYPEKLTP